MSSPYVITTLTDTLRLDGARKAEAVFTISRVNGGPASARVIVRPQDAARAEWFTVVNQNEWAFSGGEGSPAAGQSGASATHAVKLRIAVPDAVPPGRYAFRIDVVNPDNTDEDFTEGPAVAFEVKPPAPPRPPSRRWLLLVILAAVLVLGVVIYLVARPRSVVLDDLTGKTAAEAGQVLKGLGLAADERKILQAQHPGKVVDQDPPPHTKVKVGSKVKISIDSAAKVPVVTGILVDEAQAKLTAAGLQAAVNKTFRPGAPAGQVLDQTPAGDSIGELAVPVQLTVQSFVAVPNLVGLDRDAAIKKAKDAPLDPQVAEKIVAGPAKPSFVALQSPPAGAPVAENVPLTLTVQAPFSTVPPIKGGELADALIQLSLSRSGLAVGKVLQGPSPAYEENAVDQATKDLQDKIAKLNDAGAKAAQAAQARDAANAQVQTLQRQSQTASSPLERIAVAGQIGPAVNALNITAANADATAKATAAANVELIAAQNRVQQANTAAAPARRRVINWQSPVPPVADRVPPQTPIDLFVPRQRGRVRVRDLIPQDKLALIDAAILDRDVPPAP